VAGAALGMDKLAFAGVMAAAGLPTLPRLALTPEMGAVGFDGPSGVGAPTGLGAFEPAFTGSQPTVLTGKATSVSASTAVLNATVNPNGGEVTTCTFEYGPAKVLGKKASCSKLPGSGTGAVSVSVEITGLSPSTKYAFRITAKNAAGASTGKEKTLKTKA